MKYCPQCQRQYSSTRRVCPQDGSQLSLEDPYHLVGRTLEKYQVDALVGIGGMGAVYSAHQIGVGRRVAFKILQPNIVLSNRQTIKLFEREAQMAGRLNHENIAIIYDAGRTADNIWYIAMEWLEGHTLAEELATSSPLSLGRTARILRQIAAALDTAHAAYIVHRDLKPSNIMLVRRPDGRELVKVLDFGIGKVISDTAGSPVSKPWGTPHYASPEQFHTGVNLDRRADIYSLGVMLYQMLAGELPFNAPSIEELIRLHLYASPAPIRERRPEVPEAIERLVTRMLAKDPNQRPQRAGEIAEVLEQVLKTTATLLSRQDTNPALHTPLTLEMAHVVIIDLVGYARLPVGKQPGLMQQLQEIISGTTAFRRARADEQLISIPTGGGMALVFFGSPETPIECVVEISRALGDQPVMELRMGVHTGPVYRIPDLEANQNVAGGIALARRVMDCGDPGHILLSQSVAHTLRQRGTWAARLHDLGEHEARPGERIHLFNFYTDDFGNSKWPNKLPRRTRERRVEVEKARLTDLEPFGEADCESELKVLGSGEYSKYYFDHTRFNRDALNPKVFLIIGRRGAGKTALSQFFSFQQLIPRVTTIEVDEPAAFQQIMSKIAEGAAHTREVAIPRLAKIWEFVVWSTIFLQLRDKDTRIRAACLFGEEAENASAFIRRMLKALASRFLKADDSLADELEDFISAETIQAAKSAVLEVVRGSRVIIAIDTMENYAVRDEAMMRSMGALIQCASRFSRDYARHGLYLKVFIMAEIFPYLKEEVSLNPLKFIHDEIYLQWRPKDLMRLISWRYNRYLRENNLISPTAGKVDWDNHHDVLREKWEPYWGIKLRTRQGLIEETFPYVLRHTQLRPRQLIVLCNSIARHAKDGKTFPKFGPESIVEGIQQAEKRLAEEVMNSYSSVYPGAARIAEALSGLPLIFKGNELDKRAPQTASQWPPGEYSPYAFRQFVSELGIVGRVRSVSEKTGIVEADFEYAGESRISLLVKDDCVIHPMFYKKLNIRMTRNLCVYPFPDHEEFKFEVTQAL